VQLGLGHRASACPACGEETSPQPLLEVPSTDTAESFEIASCVRCGLACTLPVPQDLERYYHTDLGSSVRQPGAATFRFAQSFMLGAEARRIRRAANGATVIDVGAGSGAFAWELQRRGHAVITADGRPERPPLTRALASVPHRVVDFETGKIRGLEAPGPRVAVLRHVLEHLRSPAAFLAQLAADGTWTFYVVVPNVGSLERRLLGRSWYLWDPPRHLWHFDRATLTELLHRAGLEVFDSGHDTVPNLVPSLYRWLRLRRGNTALLRWLHPKASLSTLAAPLNWLVPGNVVWALASVRGHCQGRPETSVRSKTSPKVNPAVTQQASARSGTQSATATGRGPRAQRSRPSLA